MPNNAASLALIPVLLRPVAVRWNLDQKAEMLRVPNQRFALTTHSGNRFFDGFTTRSVKVKGSAVGPSVRPSWHFQGLRVRRESG